MWPKRVDRLTELEQALERFSTEDTPLVGITDQAARHTLAMQMIASTRRLDFTKILKTRDIHPDRANPLSPMFDPERAAMLHYRLGNHDEAIWLIFLSIHFGKHAKHGWRMLRDVYSGLGTGEWTWKRMVSERDGFREWLRINRPRIGGAFGNHRKYETLDPNSKSGTANVILSFVDECGPSPARYFEELASGGVNDPTVIFDRAYNRLSIARFGRLAKFDFLALLGRMDLALVKPGQPYLRGATGPLLGARLLVDGDSKSSRSPEDLTEILSRLDQRLAVGMQVMEDSLCNWQKSPEKFIHFKG
jgi:Alpha-glutamyl/putrescinyl thymine pyrophosphorylase clade 3